MGFGKGVVEGERRTTVTRCEGKIVVDFKKHQGAKKRPYPFSLQRRRQNMRGKKILALLILVAFVLPAVLTACGKATPTAAPATKAPAATQAPAPTEKPAATQAPTQPQSPLGVKPEDLQGVTITLWHVWSRGTGDRFQQMVDEFNSTNKWGITVKAINQGHYGDVFNKMNAAINSGDLPNIVVGYNNQMAAWDQAGGVIVDMNKYVNDPVYGLSKADQQDFYPVFWKQDVINGKRLGFPVQRSAQMMFYNITWAKELGFDKPPQTVEEFKEQSCAAAQANNSDDNPDNDGTGGYIVTSGASAIAGWIWAFGGDITDASGKYTLDTPQVQEALTYLKDLYDSGCAWSGSTRYHNSEFATRQALFTTSSTAGIPYQQSAMKKSGSKDQWTLIPFPSKVGHPVVDIYGPSMAIVKATPAQQLASWLFIKWFTSPQNQAKWVEASGYFPTRKSTVQYLGDYIKAHPQWEAAREAVEKGYGRFEPADVSWNSVRQAISQTVAKIFQKDFKPDQIPQLLKDLQKQAEEYWSEAHGG